MERRTRQVLRKHHSMCVCVCARARARVCGGGGLLQKLLRGLSWVGRSKITSFVSLALFGKVVVKVAKVAKGDD